MDNGTKQLYYDIIGAAMEVHKCLGHGFVEQVYQDALEIEFKNRSVTFEREKLIEILYKGNKISHYYKADFVCFGKIIVELKAVSSLCSEHYAQLFNYMKATNTNFGLLLNFGGKSLEYDRITLNKVKISLNLE